jgi:hypothetical protein
MCKFKNVPQAVQDACEFVKTEFGQEQLHHTVSLSMDDGSFFCIRNAFAITWQQTEYGEPTHLFVFTEHFGDFIFDLLDVYGFTNLKEAA